MGREGAGDPRPRHPGWATRVIGAQRSSSFARGILTVAILLGISWVASYLLGGAGHEPPHWFYIPILLAAARFGPPGAIAAAIAAGVLAGPLLPDDVATGSAQPLTEWLGRLGFFAGIGVVMGAVTSGVTTALEREVEVAREAGHAALHRSEGLTRSLLESTTEAVVGIDTTGTITDWNHAAAATFGWSRDEALGRALVETLIPARYREAHLAGMARYLATGEGSILGSRIELEALHRDGHELPVELVISVVEAAGTTGFVALIHDISERRRAEEARRATEAGLRDLLEAKYRALIEKLPAIVYEAEFGENGRWTYVSPQIEEMLGFAPAEWMADPTMWWQRLHPDDRPRAIADEARSRASGDALRSEYRMIARDGRIVWFRDDATVLEATLAGPVAMQGVMLDVSDQKRAEEELHVVNAELEQRVLDRTSQLDQANQELMERQERLTEARIEAERANQAKSEFLSRMSHELRTPLNAILGFGQLLDMDELTEHQQESVRQILKGGNHLLNLINEVLDISRIEVGRLQLSLEPVDVRELVDDAAALVRPLADQRQIRIEVDATSSADHYVVADRQRLQQVLLNLLSNAVKYNREAGVVRCSIAPAAGDQLRISVSDQGMGIPADELHRLFVPFERLVGDTSGIEGTGLGLALSKQLVDAMGGHLEVETVHGEGSTFTVRLPLAVAPRSLGEPLDGSATVDAPTRTVLCIDDNPANLKVIEQLVAYRPEIRLLTALQGGLGVDLARTHRPDLILLDVGLPDTSGHAVLRRLRSDPSTNGIPVIVVSADVSESQVASLLAAGARAHMTKPLDVRRMRSLLDEVLFHAPEDLAPAGSEAGRRGA